MSGSSGRTLGRYSAAVFALGVLIALIAALTAALNWPPRARLFPLMIGLPATILTLAQMILELRFGTRGRRPEQLIDIPIDADIPIRTVLTRGLEAFAWVFGLFVSILFVGFLISLPVFNLLYLRLRARAQWHVVIALVGVIVLVQIGLFHYVMGIIWPQPWFPGPERVVLEFL